MKSYLLILSVLLFCFACKTQKNNHLQTPIESRKDFSPTKNPKNIILLIGDGMGMGQISAGTYRNNDKSNLERFEVTGIHKPRCYDKLITDSAAGATAFACGEKTYYHAVGVDKDTLPLQSILEEAELKNLATGLVATSTIVHATPASFIAHNKYRKNYEEIAADFLKTDIEYFVGGGNKYFERRDTDDRNLIEELKAKDYHMGNYLTDFVDFKKSIPTKGKVGFLTADDSPLPILSGRDYFIDASMTGINFLKKQSDDGFFIAEEDMKLRGYGDLVGFKQSGTKLFKVADPVQHENLFKLAEENIGKLETNELNDLKYIFLLKLFDKVDLIDEERVSS